MGSRANLLIIEDTGYKLFYSHWAAQTLPRDVFWGPEYAIPFVLDQVPEWGWLDTRWAEGGLIINPGRHILLLYGGEDLSFDVLLRRIYLELLQETWPGWHIRWAYNGIFDMADYVHLPREKVLAPKLEKNKPESPPTSHLLEPPRYKDCVDIAGSFVFEDGSLRLFPLTEWVEDFLLVGPTLIELARNAAGVDDLPLDQWLNRWLKDASCPHGGFHIDLTTHQVAFWIAYDRPTIVEDVSQAWPGWTVLYWNDAYEIQLERTRGRLTFPSCSTDELLAYLESILVRDFTDNHGTALQAAEALGSAGYDVQVNPAALRDDPQEVSLETQREIFNRAVAAWRKRRAAAGNAD